LEKNQNIYELKFEQAITLGLSISDAAISVTEMYIEKHRILNATEKWSMPIYNWTLALSQLAIYFEGRLDQV